MRPPSFRGAVASGTLSALVLSVFLLIAGPAAPAVAFEKGFWGPLQRDGRSLFSTYRSLGVTLYQMQLHWRQVAPVRPLDETNPADPAYRWPEAVDYALKEASKYKMRVALMVIQSPAWANGGRSWEWVPSQGAFARFVRAASRRYPGVRHWMIWGEPDRSNNFKPHERQTLGQPLTPSQAAVPRRYARLVDAAYVQLKRQNRRNLVIGGNTFSYGEIRAWEWVRHMRVGRGRGRPPRMDLYGHNPFGRREPDFRKPASADHGSDFSDMGRFAAHVQRYIGKPQRRRMRLFLAEWTAPTGPDREFTFYVDRATQARWIKSAFRITRRHPGFYGLGWIHLFDEPPERSPRRQSGLISWNGNRKPGFFAFKKG